jgi:hypothetical protein
MYISCIHSLPISSISAFPAHHVSANYRSCAYSWFYDFMHLWKWNLVSSSSFKIRCFIIDNWSPNYVCMYKYIYICVWYIISSLAYVCTLYILYLCNLLQSFSQYASFQASQSLSGPGLLPFMRFHITWFQDLGPSKQFEHFWFNSASCMWPEDAGKTTGSLTCDGLLLQSLCYQTFLGFVGFD